MRRYFGIIISILLAIGVLVAINSLSYVSEEEKQDSEINPNRSTYNSGATGTRALYDFLNESGYRVMRWREAPGKLLGATGRGVKTFVIVGNTRVPIDFDEAESIRHWVAEGGTLVLADRRPDDQLLPLAGDWTVTCEYVNYPGFDSNPGSPEHMTDGVNPLSPSQPTLLTHDVQSVMPSRFMATVKILPKSKDSSHNLIDEDHEDPSPVPLPTSDDTPASPAPVVHVGTSENALLLDYPHGRGRIIVLSDPFILANGGIGLKDNLRLTLNLLTSPEGVIAFDEFHQGRAITRNEFVNYFAGTPVLAIFGQIVLLVILIVWTRGRRFARPLPLPSVDRRSSLEFVASMAELQQRAGAFDLAIENVYNRTRRVLARYAGVDYNSPRAEIARRVADRSRLDAHQLETLMRQAETAINGGAIGEKQSIYLVKRLREVENSLGLRLRSRDLRQKELQT
jgi:Domain of unknown function (DUF4350)